MRRIARKGFAKRRMALEVGSAKHRRAYKGQSSVECGTADPGGRVELSPKNECKCKKKSEKVLKNYKTIWLYNKYFFKYFLAPQVKLFWDQKLGFWSAAGENFEKYRWYIAKS